MSYNHNPNPVSYSSNNIDSNLFILTLQEYATQLEATQFLKLFSSQS